MGGEGGTSEEWVPQKPEEYEVLGKRKWPSLSNGAAGSRKMKIENVPLTVVTWKHGDHQKSCFVQYEGRNTDLIDSGAREEG